MSNPVKTFSYKHKILRTQNFFLKTAHFLEAGRAGKLLFTAFRKADGPEKCSQDLKILYFFLSLAVEEF